MFLLLLNAIIPKCNYVLLFLKYNRVSIIPKCSHVFIIPKYNCVSISLYNIAANYFIFSTISITSFANSEDFFFASSNEVPTTP